MVRCQWSVVGWLVVSGCPLDPSRRRPYCLAGGRHSVVKQIALHHENNTSSCSYHCVTHHTRPGSRHSYHQSGASYELDQRHVGGFEHCRCTLLRASGHAREFLADARARLAFGERLCAFRVANGNSRIRRRNLRHDRSAGMVFRLSDLRGRPRVGTAFRSCRQVHFGHGHHRRIPLTTAGSQPPEFSGFHGLSYSGSFNLSAGFDRVCDDYLLAVRPTAPSQD